MVVQGEAEGRQARATEAAVEIATGPLRARLADAEKRVRAAEEVKACASGEAAAARAAAGVSEQKRAKLSERVQLLERQLQRWKRESREEKLNAEVCCNRTRTHTN